MFMQPLWLLLLIPWAGLAVWMLRRRPTAVEVPFVALWRGEVSPRSTLRGTRRPPISVILLLLAILAAITGAARPMVRGDGGGEVVIVVDCGITMSATDASGRTRFERVLQAVRDAAPDRLKLSVQSIPPRRSEPIDSPAPTAVDTRQALQAHVLRLLNTNNVPVVVITDQDVGMSHDRLVVVSPEPMGDIAISHVAARANQVMAKVVNYAAAPASVTVTARSGSQSSSQSVDVMAGESSDVFLDLPLDRTVEVSISPVSANALNDVAYLARTSAWPRPTIVGAVPASLRQFIEAYTKARPPGDDSRQILISDTAREQDNSIHIDTSSPSVAATGEPALSDHQLVRNVDWTTIRDGRIHGRPPAGATPIASFGGQPAIAIGPGKRVWIGLSSPTWPLRPDYVVFLTNVLDWLGEGPPVYVAHQPHLLAPEWRATTEVTPSAPTGLWPGLYERRDGAVLAINAPDVAPDRAPPAEDWRTRVAAVSGVATESHQNVSPVLYASSIFCLLLASLALRRA